MNRRKFIKSTSGVFVPATFGILVPKLRAQDYLPHRRKAFRSVAAGGGACATSDTSLAHDEMLFGWEGGDDPTPWTGPTLITDVDAVTFDTAYNTSGLTTGKPSGACDIGLRATLTGTGGGHDSYRFDRSSLISVGTTVDVRCYVYIQTLLVGARISILIGGAATNPDGSRNFAVELQTDTVPQVRGDGATSSAWINLTENSWNLIHVHSNATNTSSTIAVNGGSAQGFSTSATAGIQYMYVGTGFTSAGKTCVWVTDLLAVNTP